MNLFLDFIGNLILSITQLLVWVNISNTDNNIFNIKVLIKVIILSLLITFNHLYLFDFLRGFLTIMLAIIFCKNILKLHLKNAIILSFISQLIVIISEALLVIIFNLVFKIDATYVSNHINYMLLLDTLVSILCFIISKIRIIHVCYKKIIKITDDISPKKILIFLLFVIFASNVFTALVYFNNNFILKLVINLIISSIYTIIIMFVFNYQQKYYKINSKYKMSLEDLQAQEHLINEYRTINHENKNQLMTIKQMSNNKKVKNYIDSLVKSNSKISNSLIRDSLKIPQGGIRGLIYNKIALMKEKSIKYYLNVDKNVTHKQLLKISDDDIVDICSILGVFIDNAIEEVDTIKEGIINIDFHISNKKLLIVVSNNYNFIKSNMKTTKGKCRGYGLKLVDKIVEKNDKITNYKEINKDTFTQKIEILL